MGLRTTLLNQRGNASGTSHLESLKGSVKQVYRPGDVHYLPRGTVKQYKMHEGCFALEYARGALHIAQASQMVY